MSSTRERLLAQLETLEGLLETADAEEVAARMDAIVEAFERAGAVEPTPVMIDTLARCQAKAQSRYEALQREVRGHAASARAAAVYGGAP
jgi:hypothetical protein